MTDKAAPKPPIAPDTGKPYDFGPNSRDVTAEHVGTVMAIVGAPKPPKDKPK